MSLISEKGARFAEKWEIQKLLVASGSENEDCLFSATTGQIHNGIGVLNIVQEQNPAYKLLKI